jgi:hypothetical protein
MRRKLPARGEIFVSHSGRNASLSSVWCGCFIRMDYEPSSAKRTSRAPSMRLAISVALIAVTQAACDRPTPTPSTKAAPAKPTPPKPPLHRFVLTRFPTDNGVAFDTQTGQICKAWEWTPTGTAPEFDKNGQRPQRAVGEFAPTCLDLYVKYPSGPGDDSQPDEPDAK